MPSLVVTKNVDGPRYADWDNASKRQQGQIFVGDTMLTAFGVNGTNVGTITFSTLKACLDDDYSIWMRYDGDENDSFAIVKSIEDKGSEEEDDDQYVGRVLRTYNLELDYVGLEITAPGTPIVENGNEKGKLKLKVREDSPPKSKKNKRMNVVIPSDFENFEEQYLKNMIDDIETITDLDEDKRYLLSSLTFRRCL